MGILSSMGNFISSGFNAISVVFSAVTNTVSAIGGRIAEFANNIKPLLGPVLTTIAEIIPHPVVKAVANFANTLLHALSIFHPNENLQDMGDRALQASEQGITIEKFENFDAYMMAMREFDLDPEVSKKYSPAEKLVAGLGVATAGIEEKFNVEPGSLHNIWLLPIVAHDYFTPDRIQILLENGKSIGDVSAYLEKRMTGGEASKFTKSLEINLEGKQMNDDELVQLYDALDQSRIEWDNLNKQLKGND